MAASPDGDVGENLHSNQEGEVQRQACDEDIGAGHREPVASMRRKTHASFPSSSWLMKSCPLDLPRQLVYRSPKTASFGGEDLAWPSSDSLVKNRRLGPMQYELAADLPNERGTGPGRGPGPEVAARECQA